MFRRGSLALLLVVVSSLVLVAGEPPGGADIPGWVAGLSGTQPSTSQPELWPESTPVQVGQSKGIEPAPFTFPKPATWDVTLGNKTQTGGIVQIGTDSAAGETLRVEILDREAAKKTGTSGFVFTLSDVTHRAFGQSLPAEVTIDYSGFAQAYGGGYDDRLGVVALAECALTGCAKAGRVLPVRNDVVAKKLVASIADLTALAKESGSSSAAFAVTADAGGDTGTYAASPLSISGSWHVSPGSGAFTYSYPIAAPAPGGGSAPSVSMAYSSAAIDGMTTASNTQASPTGIGWSDFANAFIERSYEPCVMTIGSPDLCWKSENAVISLNGMTGSLIPVDSTYTEWKLSSDPGWRIRRTNEANYTTINGNQMWKVTGPDGTVYSFGFGHMPGRQTNSILSVQVLADNPYEPCRNPDPGGNPAGILGGCEQGWRWYLDRVEDPDGNVTSYLYDREDNYYSAILGMAPNSKYHRGAMLKEIIYGGRGWDGDNYAARVTFGHQHRCGYLVPECPDPSPGQTGYPDVPTDLLCNPSMTCSVHSPSFFTTKRYTHVRTDVKIGNVWKPVAQHNIYHNWGDGENGVSYKLQVTELQHAAIAFGKLNAYPTTKFEYAYKDNRADHSGNIPKAMRHNRISKVTNPFGGVTSVTYGFNRHCSTTYDPRPRWDLNVKDCFPQSVKDGDHIRTGIFNKYLVTKVTESPGVGSPDMVTTYAYQGDPAWAFDTGAFARGEAEFGWSRWLGYGEVTVAKGVSKTRLKLFRGWNDDPTLKVTSGGDWAPIGKRTASVTASDGTSYVDHPSLGGRTLEEQQLGTINAVADSILHTRIHTYAVQNNSTHTDYAVSSQWVGLASTTEGVATAPGIFRKKRSVTTYNANRQPASTLEEGWLDVTGDERCSLTTYAAPSDPARNMVIYPSSNKKVAGNCSSAQVLTLAETYYDGSSTLGLIPTRADGKVIPNPTRQRVQLDASRWADTTTEFDEFGRPVRVVDPNGAATTTVYTVTSGAPAAEIPIRTKITNALGHEQISDWIPEFGVATKEQDFNGNITQYGYDEFGRIDTVWLPTEPVAFLEPSWRFAYDIGKKSIRSRHLVSDSRCCETAVFEDSWVIHDGFWRERQVQGTSPSAGKVLVSETTYDDRGQVLDEFPEQAFPGTPGIFIAGSGWQNHTRHTYDEIGRETRSEWFRGTSAARATATAYEADRVTVTGPDGRRVRERIDGYGRTVAMEESDDQNWVSSTYVYDLADQLRSVTDPAGNTVTYSYNMAGWKTGQTDPNRGTASFSYDVAGYQTGSADALGNQVFTNYDLLGRVKERRSGSPAGPLLASWQYDTAPLGKGALHKQTSYTATGTWISEVLGYDSKGRLTGSKVTVPQGIAGLSGSYTVSQTYDRADRVRTATYPAIGGLPQETVTMDYNNLGLATRMAGLAEYVWGVSYDDRGRKVSAGFGPKPSGATWMAKTWTFDVDQRVNGAETYIAGPGVVSDHEVTFDDGGNLKEKLTRQNGLAWRECFGYDNRSRLTAAHTVAATSACTGGTPGTGDRPYVHAYQYSPDGKMLKRTENGVVKDYGYPASGAARPHAPTLVGSDSYVWDTKGSLSSRTVAGTTETLAWDVQGQLSSVTGPAGATSFTYDATGDRLLRKTPDGKATLYVGGHEITANPSGTIVSAVRPYTFDGQLVATRTLAGVDYVISDPAGSVEMTAPSGGLPSATRSYDPYGRVRAETGDIATDRGFIGQVEDSSTKLSFMNARYYDAAIGVFISTDALMDTSKIKSLNPYGYSMNNPASFADPSGLSPSYTWGLETENAKLKAINKGLVAHIGVLNGHIAELQDIIRQQQAAIKEMLTYIDALEAEIARQASIIHQLQARVAYLQRVVAAQQREIGRLHGIINEQRKIIKKQAQIIGEQRWTIAKLSAKLAVIKFAAIIRSAVSGAVSVVKQLAAKAVAMARASSARSGGDDDDCGFSLSGAANCLQKGGHVVRAVVNAPRTAAGVGWAYANGGTCEMRSGLMVMCSGMDREWADGAGSGFTWGNTYMTTDSAGCAAQYMEHESTHATQSALFGGAWPGIYLADEILHLGDESAMWTEDWAGLDKGGYTVDIDCE